jgi:hypothetical protein
MMRIGSAYLVHCGDWHTFVGRVTEQLGPFTYAMSGASKIDNTNNNDNWHILAAGDKLARKAANYFHCETELIIPLTIAAMEWAGKTPSEEAGSS